MIVAKTGNWGYGDLCIGDADAGAYRGVGAAGVAMGFFITAGGAGRFITAGGAGTFDTAGDEIDCAVLREAELTSGTAKSKLFAKMDLSSLNCIRSSCSHSSTYDGSPSSINRI